MARTEIPDDFGTEYACTTSCDAECQNCNSCQLCNQSCNSSTGNCNAAQTICDTGSQYLRDVQINGQASNFRFSPNPNFTTNGNNIVKMGPKTGNSAVDAFIFDKDSWDAIIQYVNTRLNIDTSIREEKENAYNLSDATPNAEYGVSPFTYKEFRRVADIVGYDYDDTEIAQNKLIRGSYFTALENAVNIKKYQLQACKQCNAGFQTTDNACQTCIICNDGNEDKEQYKLICSTCDACNTACQNCNDKCQQCNDCEWECEYCNGCQSEDCEGCEECEGCNENVTCTYCQGCDESSQEQQDAICNNGEECFACDASGACEACEGCNSCNNSCNSCNSSCDTDCNENCEASCNYGNSSSGCSDSCNECDSCQTCVNYQIINEDGSYVTSTQCAGCNSEGSCQTVDTNTDECKNYNAKDYGCHSEQVDSDACIDDVISCFNSNDENINSNDENTI